jgi:hypothetical protein
MGIAFSQSSSSNSNSTVQDKESKPNPIKKTSMQAKTQNTRLLTIQVKACPAHPHRANLSGIQSAKNQKKTVSRSMNRSNGDA